MKQTLLIALSFFLISEILYAQQEIDVAPILSSCYTGGDVTMDMVNCSEQKIRSFIYKNVNEKSCPSTDSTHYYSLRFIVNKKGEGSFESISNYQENEPCMSFLENRAKQLFQKATFKAAQKDDKSVSFTKSIGFSYPLPDSLVSDLDTLLFVEEMPRFNGCEHIMGAGSDKEECAKNKLLQFIYTNLTYPKKARKNGVQGMVVVQFVIDEEGNVQDEKIVRDIGAECGDSVLAIMDKMKKLDPPFIPGMQRGKKVKVLYTLPVRFKLEGKKKKKKN